MGDPTDRRLLYTAASLNGFGTGIVASVVSVLVAERFGLVAVGITMGAGAAGRLISLTWFHVRPRISTASSSTVFNRRVIVLTAASSAVVIAAQYGPLYLIVGLAVWSTSTNLNVSSLHNHHGRKHLVALGPASMAGVAIGAIFGGVALLTATWTVAIAGVGLLVQLWQIPALGRYGFIEDSTEPSVPQWAHVWAGLMLAVCCYGPLAGYGAYVTEVTSKRWVGAAMAAYSAGALVAPYVYRRIEGTVTEQSFYLWGAIGAGTWMFAVNGPLIIAGRLLSGIVLFVAQGALLTKVSRLTSGSGGMLAVSAGLGVGSALGGVGAAWVADRWSIPVMGLIFMLLALGVAIGDRLKRVQLRAS